MGCFYGYHLRYSGIQTKNRLCQLTIFQKKSIFSQENRLFSCQRIFCQIEDRGSQCHESERRDETRSMVSMVAGAADVTVTEHCLTYAQLVVVEGSKIGIDDF